MNIHHANTIVQNSNRIISVVPSQTELLADLGLDEEVVGITKFCIHPEKWFRTKTRIGGTKKLDIEKIKSLNPDLILANKEENTKEEIEILAEHFPVYVSDITDFNSALQMIIDVGRLTNRLRIAENLVGKIKEKFATIQFIGAPHSVAYLIWKDPFMTVGSDSFIHEMLHLAGFENVFGLQTRYPETDIETLKKIQPSFIFLSSEPYPFSQKHIDELQPDFPFSKFILVDGEMFSWYGSRMLQAPDYFNQLQKTCSDFLKIKDGF